MKKQTSIFLVILLCMLVAVAAGGSSYLVLANAHDQETQSLNDQIDRLETQVTKLQKEAKSATTAKTTTTPTTTETATTTTTTDPISDWKTYSNSTYHFNFRYPNTLRLTEEKFDLTTLNNNNINKKAGIEFEILAYSPETQGPVMTIWILKSIDQAIQADKSIFGDKTNENFAVGNQTGKMLNNYSSPGSGYVVTNNKVYFFEQNNSSISFTKNIYQNILKTFIFN